MFGILSFEFLYSVFGIGTTRKCQISNITDRNSCYMILHFSRVFDFDYPLCSVVDESGEDIFQWLILSLKDCRLLFFVLFRASIDSIISILNYLSIENICRVDAAATNTTADQSHLLKASNDSMVSILSYLSMKDICQLDIAVTNTVARVIWLSRLEVTNHHTINECTHSDGSIR